MLYEDEGKILLVSNDDFYKEIKSDEDIDLSNLNQDSVKKALHSDIVMYVGDEVKTIILKNIFGKDGKIS